MNGLVYKGKCCNRYILIIIVYVDVLNIYKSNRFIEENSDFNRIRRRPTRDYRLRLYSKISHVNNYISCARAIRTKCFEIAGFCFFDLKNRKKKPNDFILSNNIF